MNKYAYYSWIDSLQPRNDQDIDVFQLNRITSKVSTVAPMIIKVVTHKTLPKSMTTGADVIEKTTKGPESFRYIVKTYFGHAYPKESKELCCICAGSRCTEYDGHA
ncbi:hypothetical protein CEXT_115971 [Caerostris extrusa]|uniref:Uncharacterized protein n=1 Tax=Caerostris extrusa TaxID=172846 RepID=A0AAV4YFU7_CAEEX|nr:hypothetical protein CEXT_115971 [Caerostris extrusa]